MRGKDGRGDEMIINGKECSCANCGNRKVLEEYLETEDGHFQGKRTCEGFACIGLMPFKDGRIVWRHDNTGMCELWKEVSE